MDGSQLCLSDSIKTRKGKHRERRDVSSGWGDEYKADSLQKMQDK